MTYQIISIIYSKNMKKNKIESFADVHEMRGLKMNNKIVRITMGVRGYVKNE